MAAGLVLAAAALLIPASPAVATPREGPARAASVTGSPVFAELLAWLNGWFQTVPPRSVSAAAGADHGPGGGAEPSPGLEDPITPQGGVGMDPDG